MNKGNILSMFLTSTILLRRLGESILWQFYVIYVIFISMYRWSSNFGIYNKPWLNIMHAITHDDTSNMKYNLMMLTHWISQTIEYGLTLNWTSISTMPYLVTTYWFICGYCLRRLRHVHVISKYVSLQFFPNNMMQ